MSSSSLCSDRQRPKRPSAITRTAMLRKWGPRQGKATSVLHQSPFQQLCGTKSHRQCPKSNCREQLSKQENPSGYESPAPPPSSSSLQGSGEKDDEGILLPSWCFTSGEGGGRGRQAKSYLKYISHDAEGCVRVSQTRSKLDLICPQKVQ